MKSIGGWKEYIFQRSEVHSIHHQYEKHNNNDGDIICWDMLLESYKNPKEFKSTIGFEKDKVIKLFEMLQFKGIFTKNNGWIASIPNLLY